ncbi:hypothetical protein CC86DRAFT_338987 [Ophiobolus disseminans]|uniref:MYND-type domain-containing protein n=1 Tax=Ophiobolus disseminans TaxID=1469910 RepID=A0A6A7AK20_9PLEO|nr:hypothetical protein CC86DRAFT_338987 [Ophiobolus disseminans]
MPSKCKERERILASGVVDVPALPVGAVRGILCFRCFEPSEKILKCGACRRAGYCSKECQRLDWSAIHKKQCKTLQRINEIDVEDYQDSRTWDDYRRFLLRYVHLVQEMTPERDTIFIIQAQPYCSTCYRSANQLASLRLALNVCTQCQLLHHCDSCPDSHTESVCAAYQTQNKIEKFRHELFEDTGKASAITCTADPHTSHKPLTNCTGWYDYFVKISDKRQIKGKITPDFSGISDSVTRGNTSQQEFEEQRRMFLLLATDTLTMPLTIVSALEELHLLKAPRLRVHLLGATGREFLAMPAFEEILHLVPGIKSLEITAVGPSSLLHGHGPEGYAPKQNIPCCDACQSKGRTRPLASYQGLYHDFAKSSHYEKPDIIVAFNSGCVDGDDADTDWDQTIRLIVDSEVPTLFTTYNPREAWHEQVKMKSLGAKFVLEPARNKWSSLVPMPEFLDEEYDIWYQNHHQYIIQGKQK